MWLSAPTDGIGPIIPKIENQREMVITPGSAVVFLPSRERGPIELPQPPGNDPVELLQHEIEELRIKNEGA